MLDFKIIFSLATMLSTIIETEFKSIDTYHFSIKSTGSDVKIFERYKTFPVIFNDAQLLLYKSGLSIFSTSLYLPLFKE